MHIDQSYVIYIIVLYHRCWMYMIYMFQAYTMWLDEMYMSARLPLPINSNVGMVFPRQHFQDQGEQLR